jgi:hypothetical protein
LQVYLVQPGLQKQAPMILVCHSKSEMLENVVYDE